MIPLPSVVDIALAKRSFSILVEALVYTDLVDALKSEGPSTVFLPNNESFRSLFVTLGVEKVADLPKEAIANILKYHVLGAQVAKDDVKGGFTSLNMLNDESVLIKKTTQGGVFVNASKVIHPDIIASNGVVHVIDKVFIPTKDQGNLATVLSNGLRNFSILIEALPYNWMRHLAKRILRCLLPSTLPLNNCLKHWAWKKSLIWIGKQWPISCCTMWLPEK